uniref:SWIM-type domain-containing protein n=1 Tax=Ananas comosus var. bracteatus TaxID=296719 RepID=A0A6V7QH15_ANACO|nr:unnamed protein product [Ananas comosus var. bracteatus]
MMIRTDLIIRPIFDVIRRLIVSNGFGFEATVGLGPKLLGISALPFPPVNQPPLLARTPSFLLPQHSTHPIPPLLPQPSLLGYRKHPNPPQSHLHTQPMESVGSNSPPQPTRYADPAQQVADRIVRALRHHLRLLHRAGPDFFVLGATGNVYAVTLSAPAPSCTCPDRAPVPCKHVLFVLLRVLGLSFNDACVWLRQLRPCQLARLLAAPTAPGVLAGARARARFHELFSGRRSAAARDGEGDAVRARDGGGCARCVWRRWGGDGGDGKEVAVCSACGNWVHGECMTRWKRSRGRRAASCVVCRARWRERRERNRYINLSAYVSEEEEETENMNADDEAVEGSCGG